MSSEVIGQFVTAAEKSAMPQAATSGTGRFKSEAAAQPKAPPIQKDGTISPPLNPAAIVSVVKTILRKKASAPTM